MERAKLFERLGTLERDLAELRRQLGIRGEYTPLPHPPSDPSLLHLIVEYAADCISVHEPGGRYVYASRGFESHFGWPPEELIGRSAYEYFHPEDIVRIADDHAAHGEGGREQAVAYRLRRADGNYRWVETRSRAHVNGSGVQRIICFTRDLTEIFQTLTQLRGRVAELDSLSSRDELTGIANRRRLIARLNEVMKEAQRGRRFAVAFVDIDRFKTINDQMGHAAGDDALIAVARALQGSCRDVDFVARIGGDEFCVLYLDAGIEAAQLLAERQRHSVQALRLGGTPLSISLGVAAYEEGDDTDGLLRRADAALYDAKRKGRNRVQSAGDKLPSDAPSGILLARQRRTARAGDKHRSRKN